jgi:hypothetical protein
MGYDTLNEPHHGYFGLEDISTIPKWQELRNGLTPSAIQGMVLGMGKSVFVDSWRMGAFGPYRSGEELVDPNGTIVWLKDTPKEGCVESIEYTGNCIWADHGVWDQETGKVCRPDYFCKFPETGMPLDFSRDCFKPFVLAFTKAIRSVHVDAIIFIEPAVNEPPPIWEENDSTSRMAFAPHFYDGLTLMNKKFCSWMNIDYLNAKRGKYWHYATSVKFGASGIQQAFTNQLETIKKEGRDNIGNIPCVIGEIGMCFYY